MIKPINAERLYIIRILGLWSFIINNYLVRRLLLIIPTFIGIILVVFANSVHSSLPLTLRYCRNHNISWLFGLQPPTPSRGELLSVGTSTWLEAPLILSSAMACFVLVLVMLTFIGEGLQKYLNLQKGNLLQSWQNRLFLLINN